MAYTLIMKGGKPVQSPNVGIVVVGWNNQKLLDECFASVYAQTYLELTLIYVDNGSHDGSVAHVREHHPKAVVIDVGWNSGFAMGNNLGFAKALENPDCQYVVALNTDAFMEPDWAVKMVAFAQEHPEAAGLQSLMLQYHDHNLLDSAGIYIDLNAAPLQIGYNKPDEGYKTGEVFGVNAAVAMYTRGFLEQQPFASDYFDHDLFMYYEDVDLSARALAMGMKNYFYRDAVAYHMGSVSSGGNPAFMLRMVHRNLPLIMVKNIPWSIILRCLPGWTNAEIKRLVTFWRERRYGLVKAMLVGRIKGLWLIPKFLAKRRKLYAGHRVDVRRFKRLMS